MKNVIELLFVASIILIISCSKENECDSSNPKCTQVMPNPDSVTCDAYWKTWIYNPETKTCTEVGYSGCDKVGFDTKSECENCGCDE